MKDIEKLKTILKLIKDNELEDVVTIVNKSDNKEVNIDKLLKTLNKVDSAFEKDDNKDNDDFLEKLNDSVDEYRGLKKSFYNVIVSEMLINNNDAVSTYKDFIKIIKSCYVETKKHNTDSDNIDLYNYGVINKVSMFLICLFQYHTVTTEEKEKLINMFFNIKNVIEL